MYTNISNEHIGQELNGSISKYGKLVVNLYLTNASI